MKRWLPMSGLLMASWAMAQPRGKTLNPSATPDYIQLDVLIDAGQPRRAAPVFRAELAKNPLNHAARVGLGRALSSMNRCEESLIHLRAGFPTDAWTAKAALAEARCHWRAGDVSLARVAFVETLAMNAALTPARHEFVLFLIEQGDYDEALWHIGQMEAHGKTNHRPRVLMLRLTIQSGLNPWGQLEQLRVELKENPQSGGHQQLLTSEGLLWLDDGDPDRAAIALNDAVWVDTSYEAAVIWRAEALRRSGFTDDARQVAWRRTLRESSLLHPIRARVLADLGDLDGARAELELSPPGAPETLASQWYVAERAGQDSTAWATVWEETPHPPGRTLDQLLPLENE